MKTAEQLVIDEVTAQRENLRRAVRALEARGEKQAALHATGAIDSLDRCLSELHVSAQLRRGKADAA